MNNHEVSNEFYRPKYNYVLVDCEKRGYCFVTGVNCSDEELDRSEKLEVNTSRMCKPMGFDEELAQKVCVHVITKGKVAYIFQSHFEIKTQFFASLNFALNNFRRCVESMSRDRGQLIEALREVDKNCEHCAVAQDASGKRPCPNKNSECQTCTAKCPCAGCVDNCNWTWGGGVGSGMDR